MSRKPSLLSQLTVAALLFGLLAAACGPRAAIGSQAAASGAGLSAADQAVKGTLQVEVIGPLETLDAASATVGGTRLLLSDSTSLAGGLQPSQWVAAQAVVQPAGLAALSLAPAPAGRSAGQTFNLSGVIQSQAAGVWVVSGHSLQVEALSPPAAALSLGDRVQVRGSVSPEGALLAREIQALSSGDPNEIEFTGVLTSIGAHQWVIGAHTVTVTSQTEVKPGLALGTLVKVHALPQADGSWLAREIEPAPGTPAPGTPQPADELEFIGVLSAIDGEVWTVGTRAVRITAQTEVKDALRVGDLVKVHARPDADGVLVAREIELAEPGDVAGVDDDDDDDQSGSGSDDDDDDDSSGSGGGSDDDDDDSSGSGNSGSDNSGSGNSGSGSSDDDDDDDSSGSGSSDDSDDDDDDDDEGRRPGGLRAAWVIAPAPVPESMRLFSQGRARTRHDRGCQCW